MNVLKEINREYTRKLNNLITRKWCIGRRFRWYGQQTFNTRMDQCVERNYSIPSKITKTIIKNIKKKINETTLENYKNAIEETKNIFNIPEMSQKSKSRFTRSFGSSQYETNQVNLALETLNDIDFFLENYISNSDIFSDIVDVEKTVNVVLFYNFLKNMTTGGVKKGTSLFRTHFGGSRKTRKNTRFKT